jgi:hypothetical protein
MNGMMIPISGQRQDCLIHEGGIILIKIDASLRGGDRNGAPNQARRAFGFLEINRRAEKPRNVGLTEIRGPYYSLMGRRYLEVPPAIMLTH